ncbi:MAG TPA: hypothetical protein VHM24_13320, partial [Gemmatimonadaceae bacterium]|nr:hypothetical protein [Gemmatimonadaceae bacterium]
IVVLAHGKWHDRQVVSTAWIDRSTARYTEIGSRGYGYLWWHQDFDVTRDGRSVRVKTIVASGNGGQKIYVIPSLEAVVVFTGGSYNTGNSAPNLMMPREILPSLLFER